MLAALPNAHLLLTSQRPPDQLQILQMSHVEERLLVPSCTHQGNLGGLVFCSHNLNSTLRCFVWSVLYTDAWHSLPSLMQCVMLHLVKEDTEKLLQIVQQFGVMEFLPKTLFLMCVDV